MAEFKVVIADPNTGETFQREVDGQDANRFLGRDIGDGSAATPSALRAHDRDYRRTDGRPMREDVSGTRLKELLLEGGVGFEPSREGERKRITVRGREIDNDVGPDQRLGGRGDDVAAALGEGDADADDADEE